jgi:hypothetical protein
MLRDRETNEDGLIGKGSIELPQGRHLVEHLAEDPPPESRSGAWIGQGEFGGWVQLPNQSIHVHVGMWAPRAGYTYNLKLAGRFGQSTTLFCILDATPPTSPGLQAYTHTIVNADATLPFPPNEDGWPKDRFNYATLAFEDLGYSCTLAWIP